MGRFLENLLSSQTPPPGSSEGLPYWIFWLLLCVILLLVTFIFLRDRRLRRRLDLFFFRAKKKLIKMRLHARLKKEEKKKTTLLIELGQTTWEDGIKTDEGAHIEQNLEKLTKDRTALEKKSNETEKKMQSLRRHYDEYTKQHNSEIEKHIIRKKPITERLDEVLEKEKKIETEVIERQKELEDTIKQMNISKHDTQEIEKNIDLSTEEKAVRMEKTEGKTATLNELENKINQRINSLVKRKTNLEKEKIQLQDSIDMHDKAIKKLKEETRQKTRKIQKEILEWKMTKEKIIEKLRIIENKCEPLYEELGKIMNRTRNEHDNLIVFYSQIDRINARIKDVKQQIEELN